MDYCCKEEEIFCNIWTSKVHREGSSEFLGWLRTTKFFIQPASTRFHLSCEHGLVMHSLHVYQRLCNLYANEVIFNKDTVVPSEESIVIVSLCHDICKHDVYTMEPANRKNYDPKAVAAMKNTNSYAVKRDTAGEFFWETVMKYGFDDPWPYGHGEKSVELIRDFMSLTKDEAFAIRWHMGAFGSEDARAVGTAFEKSTLALMLHIADLQASKIDEVSL